MNPRRVASIYAAMCMGMTIVAGGGSCSHSEESAVPPPITISRQALDEAVIEAALVDLAMGSDDESETLLRGFLSPALFEHGLICRADDRGDPVVQISPPLVAGLQEFDEIVGILGEVLTKAWRRME